MNIKEINQQIEQKLAQISLLKLKVKKLRLQLKDLEKPKSSKCFSELLKLPHITNVELYKEEWLLIDTDDIKIKKTIIGKFKICLNLKTYSVRLHNMSKKAYDLYDHPHISNGRPCLGNIGIVLRLLIKKQKYSSVLSLLIKYLESYNIDGAYISPSELKNCRVYTKNSTLARLR